MSLVSNYSVSWQAGIAQSGFANPISNNNSTGKQTNLNQALANNVPGGGDSLYAALLSISPSSSTTITLNNYTDAAGETAQNFQRVKFWHFHLVSQADDAVNGTACSSITVGGGSNPFAFANTGTGGAPIFQLNNGNCMEYADSSSFGFTVATASANIKITNLDASNTAAVLAVIAGGSS